ncbi:MAG TPA: LuxR C-terminal-related transcriptional regulator [Vicinamibacteria bacterium]|nr:LuxR C-terminal-related transcriptional regulator [Vicinamibacteria bacterium]
MGISTHAGAGIVILDASLRPVYANPAALQILAYPQLPGRGGLRDRIADLLRPEEPRPRPFVSGRRRYICRFYALGPPSNGSSQTATAVILERGPNGALDLTRAAIEYNLTPREGETIGYLVEGLTSKEIAQRMGISPNTVKVFLRLAMVKMGVTTRSGILGVLFTRRDEELRHLETSPAVVL